MQLSGPGAIELTGSASLLNSTLTFTGPEGNLINDGTMGLMGLTNSQLMIQGSLAGTGVVIATDGSVISASSSVPCPIPYYGYNNPPDPTVTATSTSSSEVVILEDSTLNIGSGTPSSVPGSNPLNFWTAPVVMDAASTVNLSGTFNVEPSHTLNVIAINPSALGTVKADGPTDIAGSMNIDANLVLGSVSGRYSVIDVTNGGRLALGGAASGGTIAITAGTLEFTKMGFAYDPETESQKFSDYLSFNGQSGAVQFDGAIGSLVIGISPQLNEIAVFTMVRRLQTFALVYPTQRPTSRSMATNCFITIVEDQSHQ